MAPGGVIPEFRPSGSMLLAVERGMIVAGAERDQTNELRLPVTLSEGGGATVLQENVAATIRNVGDESAVVLALIIAPMSAPCEKSTFSAGAPSAAAAQHP